MNANKKNSNFSSGNKSVGEPKEKKGNSFWKKKKKGKEEDDDGFEEVKAGATIKSRNRDGGGDENSR